MDLHKIRVRQDLERMVINYRIMGDITEDQCARICDYIDNTIGGGALSQPIKPKLSVIPFPTTYTGEKEPTSDVERAKQTARQAARSEIYAPYGESLPEGVHDFRQSLQRDGLVLIYYEMRTSREGNFFNVLWAQSNSNSEPKRRLTEWSGPVREEEIPYVLPLDSERSWNYHTEYSFVYSVGIAADNILKGPLQEFYNYVESLKAAGFKNNFDYVFNFAAEKRNRYMEKNKELVSLKLPPRTLHALNERDIHTKKDLQKLSVQELRAMRNLGVSTVEETITVLKQAGITLQEEKKEPEENYGQRWLEF